MKYDADRVAKLSSEIYKALDDLVEISGIPKADFLQKRHIIAGAKYYFIVAIEASIDLSNHLISQNNFPIPESYADSFRILKDEGALSQELTLKLMDMARFRNRLVHIYWDVDDEMIYEILNQDINDIRTFLKAYLEFLKK
ncbi:MULTISPECIES: type VII toxin-antitoxin system HepT family RNase toxin [Methanobacterium]|uniref:DUF86 domain-containing protein n=1 Tax=Methanobacterium subterraneum TaxID=59277 RepID=A0A2H4VDJ5_9EURY|nr:MULTISPECIES: DUF86 domain-containing protein [Methanobacterium]MBW4257721.1 DUF86 domain-containing protein [Methanobacterium sp. YSL]PKL74036.1 MAG: DUF86 domain-containing protein [Methanobacteriales archaeon HGW-Methanobacteriales-2]AUB56110.1 hypothetical protein BK007_08915 [Methanobacterium subterraneum]AUB56858.1 hypothetical protein BK008_00040 [Methanobacterium sp. MZ-A1]NMO08659.1 DUF86 domain-containing protein [Methanobacterium subterraneum]